MDLVKLDMPPYDAEKHKCLTSPVRQNPSPAPIPTIPFTAVNAKFAEQAPTLTEFLSKVSVPLPVMNETLAHGRIRRRIRRRGQAVPEEPSRRLGWVPADVAGRVQSAL